MKKTTARLALGSTFLLMVLGLGGCGGSQQADRGRTADDHAAAVNKSPETGEPGAAATRQPDGEEFVGQAAQRAIEPATPPSDRMRSATAPAPRDARARTKSAMRSKSASRSAMARRSEPKAAEPGSGRMTSAKAMSPTEAAIREVLDAAAADEPSPGSAPKVSVMPEPKPRMSKSPLTAGGSSAAGLREGPGGGASAPMEAAAPEPSPTMAPRMMKGGPPPEEPSGMEPSARAMTAASEPDEATAPAEPAAATPAADYTLVKVFYGTDRTAIADTILHPLGKIPWGTLTAAAGGVTLLLLVILLFARRSVPVRLGVFISLLATIGLGVCMFQIPRNTKPEEADTSLAYGNGRGVLEMGVCEVSIPKEHEVGELESPSILRLEFNEDPEKHVVLMKVQREEPDEFYQQLRQRVDQDPRREAFVFVHGYNVTFENAARRTAQLTHDLHFDGAPIFYSWPSQGGLLQYAVDEENVVWTVPHLKAFLLGVAEKTKARRIHLIAHSMGNRALTAALEQLARDRSADGPPLFHEVLLTAPDIDAEIFRRDIAPAIVKTAERVTLYASSRDAALAASKQFHGHPRAGESGENIVVIPGIDTIDVSAVDTSLVGHSYYGDSDSVLVDMAQLLHDQKPPELRDRLRGMTLGTLRYWVFLAKQMGLGAGQTQP